MYAVKSDYSVQPPDGKNISFYVAGGHVFFRRADLQDDIDTSLFLSCYFLELTNYTGYFIRFDNLKTSLESNMPRCFRNKNIVWWIYFIYNNNLNKVVAEVTDAQYFVKEYFHLEFPQDWSRLNVDAIIANLPIKATAWIEKCYKSLQILATNDEQIKFARRVYNEAWKIIKAREKDNRPTLRELLTKFSLTDDDLIQAVLDVHETKFTNEQARRKTEFDKQRDELKCELTRLIK